MSTATAETVDLGAFEGRAVIGTSLSIRNTGHGLEKAMEVEAAVFEHHDKVYVVLECEVEKIRHDPSKDDPNELVRVHMMVAGTATFVDKDLVDSHLREMEKRIEEHRGILSLDLEGEQHTLDHEDGKHADGLVDGCPKCASETAAAEAEAAGKS